MAEAERQIRVARRLYEASAPERPWNELNQTERRPFIDQSCEGHHRDEGIAEAINFVALDFETANASLSSVCQVGIAEFSDGIATTKFESLINPEEYFDEINISIHGINGDDVVNAPIFSDIYDILAERLSGKTVVSHTLFDRSVLRQTVARYGLAEFECRWLDSARIVRRTWTAHAKHGYGLGSIASKLGIEFKHHNALEDATAAGMILIRAIAESGISLEEWMVRSFFPIGDDGLSLHGEGNPRGPLFGECLVFTGALAVPRREAADVAAELGCIVTDSVTKKTSILVVGDQDITRLATGQTKSTKHRKAEILIEAGNTIRIIGESDFMALCRLEMHPT
jgi:DNA polymerase-3 subunit epsilon